MASPTVFNRLFASVAAAHFADQIALAALPLTAVLALNAGPGLVGTLVAAQGAAWLLVSLPAGVIVDRVSRWTLIMSAQALAGLAFLAAGWFAGQSSAALFGLAAAVGASGAVVVVLSSMALVPGLASREKLPSVNARLELARAVMSLIAPVAAGFLADRGAPAAAYGIAAGASLLGVAAVWNLRDVSRATVQKPSIFSAIREGASFVGRHDLLRGIVLCAVFWNFAYFALIAAAVPFLLQRVGLDARMVGLAQSGGGVGLVVGALSAGAILRWAEPRTILVAGPAVSVLAAFLLFTAPVVGGMVSAFLAFFLIGFGPMLWLICQTSIRQLVTPAELLGRVAATIQVAIYGVRPLGALAGGWIASLASLEAALLLVLVSFGLSLAVPLLSALGRLRALPVAQAG